MRPLMCWAYTYNKSIIVMCLSQCSSHRVDWRHWKIPRVRVGHCIARRSPHIGSDRWCLYADSVFISQALEFVFRVGENAISELVDGGCGFLKWICAGVCVRRRDTACGRCGRFDSWHILLSLRDVIISAFEAALDTGSVRSAGIVIGQQSADIFDFAFEWGFASLEKVSSRRRWLTHSASSRRLQRSSSAVYFCSKSTSSPWMPYSLMSRWILLSGPRLDDLVI